MKKMTKEEESQFGAMCDEFAKLLGEKYTHEQITAADKEIMSHLDNYDKKTASQCANDILDAYEKIYLKFRDLDDNVDDGFIAERLLGDRLKVKDWMY